MSPSERGQAMDLIHVTEAIRLCGLSDMEFISEIALERGTAVHAAIALDCGLRPDGSIAETSQLDEATVDPVHVAPRLASFRKWRAAANPRIIACERSVISLAMRYRGRLDLLVEMTALSRGPVILDIKNGSPAAWHSAQTAGYAIAFAEEYGIATPSRACIYIDANGAPAKLIVHNDRRDLDRWKAIVTVAYMKKEMES